MRFRGPRSIGRSPVHLHLYLADANANFARAVAAGEKGLKPLVNQFYGDRSGSLEDPFGHVWHVATHEEGLSLEEIQERVAA